MAKFLTELDARLLDDDRIWVLDAPLVYQSDILGVIDIPAGFQTDFSSVPRIPVAYMLFGDRAHRESVIHDWLYRIDSIPPATRKQADNVFLEAMIARGKGYFVRWAMYQGVRLGGASSWHKKKVGDKLFP